MEPTKAGTCAHDRRALQKLALNVHVKHSDLVRPVSVVFICLVLYLKKIFLSKNLVLYCLVLLSNRERDVAQR